MYLERALSNRSSCKCCKNDIVMNDIRLVIEDYSYGNLIKKFQCCYCAVEFIKDEIEKLRELEYRLSLFVKEKRRE